MQELPAWLKDKTNAARQLLGIGDEWNIFVRLSDDLAKDPYLDGDCEADATALCATIRYASSLVEKDGEELTIHEMLHVLHSEVDQFVHLLAQDHEDEQMLLAMYEAHQERFVVRLSRALVRNVKEAQNAGTPET